MPPTPVTKRQRNKKPSLPNPLHALPIRKASRFGGYGWSPDIPDARDKPYIPSPDLVATNEVDLRSDCPTVYTQGQINSCSANAVAGAIAYNLRKQQNKRFLPSRLFIYYTARAIIYETNVLSDSHASLRDCIKAVVQLGAPPEKVWPYDANRVTKRPDRDAFEKARELTIASYFRVEQNLAHMRLCLAAGYPFCFGITIYESFKNVQNKGENKGFVSMPDGSERAVGAHAGLAVGYDNSKTIFIARNSWGAKWGDRGYYYIPYDYLLNQNLASDFWMIGQVIKST